MSAQARIARVDELIDLSAGHVDMADYEPSVERIALLLEGIAEAQAATAEALLESRGHSSAGHAAHSAPTRHQIADE